MLRRRAAPIAGVRVIGEIAATLDGENRSGTGPVYHHAAGVHATANGRDHVIIWRSGAPPKHPDQPTRRSHGDHGRFTAQVRGRVRPFNQSRRVPSAALANACQRGSPKRATIIFVLILTKTIHRHMGYRILALRN